MRFTSLMMAAAFLAASGAAMADQMSGASPKPTGAMHSTKSSSMKNEHMKSGSSMKSENTMKSNSMKSSHAMASPKPTSKP